MIATTERTPTAPTVASIVAHMHRIDAHTDPYVPAVVRFTAFMTAVDWYYGTAVWNAAWMQYQRDKTEGGR